jgi:hypothetical protein
LRAVLRGCHKRLRELNGPGYVAFDCRRNNGRPRFPSCRPGRLESVAAIANGEVVTSAPKPKRVENRQLPDGTAGSRKSLQTFSAL